MSELDDLEEIDIAPHPSAGSVKRIRNGVKQCRKFRVKGRNWNWKKVLHSYETRKTKQAAASKS